MLGDTKQGGEQKEAAWIKFDKLNYIDFIKITLNINLINWNLIIQGVFFNWYPPKKLKYGKPRLGESTLT